MFDLAELCYGLTQDGWTEETIGKEVGWDRSLVNRYRQVREHLHPRAWNLARAFVPKNGGVVTETDDGLVTPIVPIGTWRESYFRALLRHLPCTNGDHGAMRAQIAVLTADERRQRNELIFDLWLAGHTEPQIAHKVELSLAHVHRIIDILRQAKAGGTENIEKLPIYNVWNYPKCDPRFGLGYPGRPPRGAPAQGLEAPTPGVD